MLWKLPYKAGDLPSPPNQPGQSDMAVAVLVLDPLTGFPVAPGGGGGGVEATVKIDATQNAVKIDAAQNTVKLDAAAEVGIKATQNTVKLDAAGNTVKLDAAGNTVKLEATAAVGILPAQNTVKIDAGTNTVKLAAGTVVKVDESAVGVIISGAVPIARGVLIPAATFKKMVSIQNTHDTAVMKISFSAAAGVGDIEMSPQEVMVFQFGPTNAIYAESTVVGSYTAAGA